jgi:segregation and condensation protein A
MVDGGILARPPLNLLVDPNAAKRKSPWEIHISELLDMFLEAILKSEFLDLRAAGTAALTSATIYRFKVESLFFFEKLQRERKVLDAVEPPQIVVMPFRYEVYSTTVDELFDALSRILEEIVHDEREEGTVPPSLLEEGPPPNFEDYLVTILSNMQAFSLVLRERIGALGRIKFSDLIAGMPVLEAARTFILLLFMASNGTVVLDQNEGEEDDLLIILVG